MYKKLKIKEVKRVLKNKNIKLLETYINTKTRRKFQCLIENCQHIWTTTPQNILNKNTGCPKCYINKRRLNIIEVKKRLKAKNIQLMSEFNGVMQSADFLCLVENCQYRWTTTPDSIFSRNTQCPQCVGRIKLTNKILDMSLKSENRSIKRNDDVINSNTPIQFECLIENCKYKWYTTPNHIMNNSGCPQCSGNRPLTNKIADDKLVERNIRRLEDIKGIANKIFWECLINNCGHKWKATPGSILNIKSGCPKCAGNLPLTNQTLDQKLIDKNIKRIDDYIGAKTSIFWECLIETCGHKWKAQPTDILHKNSGCPKCSLSKNEKLTYKILAVHLNDIINKQTTLKKIITNIRKNIKVDFYIAPNIIIEYNGEQHYEPVCFGGIEEERADKNFIKQKKRDKYLRKKCKENNIHLIEIDGRKYKGNKLEKYLIDAIIPQIKNLMSYPTLELKLC